MPTLIRGNRVLLSDEEPGPATLTCSDGRIAGISSRHLPGPDHDARDWLVVPGMVDLHGDAFERQIYPRPQAGIPAHVGLLETDRQMIANGITTAFHGLTVTWEPGARDIHSARATLAALDGVRHRLCCDTRIHLRHEALSLDTVDEICKWLGAGCISVLAFNDHRKIVRRGMEGGPVRDTVSISRDDYTALAKRVFERQGEVAASLQKLAAAARDSGVPLISHDDNTPEDRAAFRAMGCAICEFPADDATAGFASAGGDEVILGSPNILRGRSHCGRAAACEIVARGWCSILCSDYYYPAMLLAPFLLAAQGVLTFYQAWGLVSSRPAHAAGLRDRGTIAPGMRADLLFLDDRDPTHPEVRAVFTKGRLVYSRGTQD